eukprot:746830-Hanusia_phi.AAC.3
MTRNIDAGNKGVRRSRARRRSKKAGKHSALRMREMTRAGGQAAQVIKRMCSKSCKCLVEV